MRPNAVIAVEPRVSDRCILRCGRDDLVRNLVDLRRTRLAKLEWIHGEFSRELLEMLFRRIAHAEHHEPRHVRLRPLSLREKKQELHGERVMLVAEMLPERRENTLAELPVSLVRLANKAKLFEDGVKAHPTDSSVQMCHCGLLRP